MKTGYPDRIFSIKDTDEFEKIAFEVFHYQAENNSVYRQFINRLGISVQQVDRIERIPFLPAEFFRNQIIISGTRKACTFFESTGTTGITRSRHYIVDINLYDESLIRGFRFFYGNPGEYVITALLPSYIEQPASSLVYMVNKLIESGSDRRSMFIARSSWDFIDMLRVVLAEGKKAMLIGVSFALLDFAEKYPADLNGLIIAETGGMKGRRKEITRDELHSVIKNNFNVPVVHSEYGMTELLSQAWSSGGGIFSCPPWMKILVREINDPLSVSSAPGKTGGINVIDLANINSCSFVATGDIGRLHEEGRFEVLGRYDHSETRGCNLMAE
ncbi:MAG: acyltransferase [Bacteroidales bacterium]